MALARIARTEANGSSDVIYDFVPKKSVDAVAVVFTPKELLRDQPKPEKLIRGAESKVRDELVCTVTVFNSLTALENGRPDFGPRDQKVCQSQIMKVLVEHMGQDVPGRVVFGTSAWFLNDVSDNVYDLVSDYLDGSSPGVAANEEPPEDPWADEPESGSGDLDF